MLNIRRKMKVYKKIMVACDLSEYSFQAIKHAAELAESLKAELIIVNVINQRDYLAVKEAMARIGGWGTILSSYQTKNTSRV